MPVYMYRCENCGARFERQQSFGDAPLKMCPECHKKTLQRVIGASRIIFKGSGFYATDNKSASGDKSGNNHKKEDGKAKDEGKPKEASKTATAESKPSAPSTSESSE